MLGASMPFLKFSEELMEKGIQSIFHLKGEQVIAFNVKAMQLGNEHSLACLEEIKKEL